MIRDMSFLYSLIIVVLCMCTHTSGYDVQLAHHDALIAAASYCSIDSLKDWNCSACNGIPNTKLLSVAYDALTDTFAIITVRYSSHDVLN